MSYVQRSISEVTMIHLAAIAVLFMLVAHSGPASAQARCWTAAGSTGSVDEADVSAVQFDSVTAGVKSTLSSGTVHLRYNVTAVDGVFGGVFNAKRLIARIADNGAAAQGIVRLRRMNVSTGVGAILGVVDTNTFPASTVAQRRCRTFNSGAPELDFVNNVYWVDVELFKTGASALTTPLIRAVQVCASPVAAANGSAC